MLGKLSCNFRLGVLENSDSPLTLMPLIKILSCAIFATHEDAIPSKSR